MSKILYSLVVYSILIGGATTSFASTSFIAENPIASPQDCSGGENYCDGKAAPKEPNLH